MKPFPAAVHYGGLRIEPDQLPFMEPAKETVERWEMKHEASSRRYTNETRRCLN
ncbi:hypothetical protein [Pseudarthrobacter sp. YAF2]|uniref:hypothetical protein n=1 Tax=Pseudarthrobacter sp. YAF2 TaxID=3233078 RepID=UPI003F9DD11F